MILLLEDNPDRLRRFAAALHDLDTALELKSWRSARQMVREVAAWLPAARLISLDHDLEPWQGDLDEPGDGLEVVRFLVEQSDPFEQHPCVFRGAKVGRQLFSGRRLKRLEL